MLFLLDSFVAIVIYWLYQMLNNLQLIYLII